MLDIVLFTFCSFPKILVVTRDVLLYIKGIDNKKGTKTMKEYKVVSTTFRLTTRLWHGHADVEEFANLSEVDQSLTWFEEVWQKGESWTLEVMHLSAGKLEDKWVTIDHSSY
jgi:hypothetical protein